MDNNVVTTVTLIDGTSTTLERITAAYNAFNEVMARSGTYMDAVNAAAGVLAEGQNGLVPSTSAVADAMNRQAMAAQRAGEAVTQLAEANTTAAATSKDLSTNVDYTGAKMQTLGSLTNVAADAAYTAGGAFKAEGVVVAEAVGIMSLYNAETTTLIALQKAAATAAAEAAAALAAQTAATEAAELAALNEGLALAYENLAMDKEIATLVADAAALGYFTEAQVAAAAAAGYNVTTLEGMAIAYAAESGALAENTGQQLRNAAATGENALAHGRLHTGIMSTGIALTPLAIGLIGVGIALDKVTKAQMEWTTEMVELQNNTAATDATMKQMSQSILDTAAATGANSEAMAVGARHVMDYGFAGAEAVRILNEATKLAVATGADEAGIAQTVSQALHQYGLGAEEAASFVNTLYSASLRANSTVEQFGASIFRVTGLAAAVGVPFDQATAAVSALTRELGNSTQAQTQVLNIMRFILKPTQEEADAWDSLSKKSGDLAISSENLGHTLSEEGLTGIFKRVGDATRKLGLDNVDLAKQSFELINAQRGGLGMFALLTIASKDYTEGVAAAGKANDGVGASQEALNRKLETAQGKWDLLGASIHRATVEGSAFDEAAGHFADGIRAGAEQWGRFFHLLGGTDTTEQAAEELRKLGLSLEELDAEEKKAADQGVYFGSVANDLTRTVSKENDALAQQQIKAALAEKAQADLAAQTGKLKDAFNALGDIKAAGGTQSLVQQMTNDLNQLQQVFAEKGAEAAAEYAQSLLDRFAALPPETRAALDPILQILQEFIGLSGGDGSAAGSAWGSHFHSSLASWQNDIQAIFDQYSTAADMRALFQQLGIETGDNYAANVHDRVAAWFEPFKQALMAYLEAVQVTANATEERLRATAKVAANIASAMSEIPFVGEMVAGELTPKIAALNAAAAQGAVAAQKEIADTIAKLSGLEAQVNQQADAAIAKHNADAAKKAAGGGGVGPEQGALTEDKRNKAVEDATAKLNAILLEAKLRQEKEALTTAQEALNAVTTTWNALLKGEQGVIAQGAADHKAGMASMELDIRRVSKALDEMRDRHAAVIADMDEKIYQYDQQLIKLGHDAETALAPLEDAADAAAKALSNLQKETAAADLAFTRAKESVQDEQYAFEAQAKLLMGPLDEAYKLAQANLDAVAEKYKNKLFPIERELLDLQQQQQKIDRGKALADEAQEVGNLQARLAAALPGSREYFQLLKMRDEASGKLGRDVRIDQLTTEKEKIEKARDAEMKRAQEAVKAAKEARDAEAELLDKQRQALAERLEAINREQTLYDRQQRDKMVLAQQAKDQADSDLKDAQDKWAEKKKLIQDEIDKIREKETVYKHDSEAEEGVLAARLKALNAEKTERDQKYQDWQSQEADKLAKMQGYADDAIAIAKGTVDTLAKILSDDEKAKEASDFLNKLRDATGDLAIALKTADLPIKIKGVGTETSGLSEAARTGALNAIALATALTTNLSPAIGAMSTTTSTGLSATATEWDKIFGVKGQSDPKNIPNKLFKHTDEGFFTNMDNRTVIAMDWSKGVWNGKLVELANTVIDGNLIPMATSAGLAAQGVGASMDTGIAKGITDHQGEIGDALIAAVDDALGRAKNHIESLSPSKKAAREVGYPIALGIVQGLRQGREEVGIEAFKLAHEALLSARRGATIQPVSGGGESFSVSGVTLNLSLPNVSKLPTNPNDYRDAASAIMYAIAYEARRRGLKEIVVQP